MSHNGSWHVKYVRPPSAHLPHIPAGFCHIKFDVNSCVPKILSIWCWSLEHTYSHFKISVLIFPLQVIWELFKNNSNIQHHPSYLNHHFSPLCPNRMDGTKTTSLPQWQHLKGTGSSPSPRCPQVLFRCLRSTTPVCWSWPQTLPD